MKIYLSHPIRGPQGANASFTLQKQNCEAAIAIGDKLRSIFPTVEFYIPAESEDFVRIAYQKLFLTEKQILEIDCGIIKERDAVIVLRREDERIQGGRLVEYNFANNHSIPALIFTYVDEAAQWIANLIMKG